MPLSTTIAELRSVLRDVVGDRANMVCWRLKTDGILPLGTESAGRGKSPEITPKEAAIALLLVAMDTQSDLGRTMPRVREVAAYRLYSYAIRTPDGHLQRRLAPPHLSASGPSFISILEGEIAATAADPNRQPAAGVISENASEQSGPDRLTFRRGPPSDDPELVHRQAMISGRFIRQIAMLFANTRTAEAA